MHPLTVEPYADDPPRRFVDGLGQVQTFVPASLRPDSDCILSAMAPGTRSHQRLNLQGRLIGQTTGNNLDGTTNFIPRMNRETLREGYRRLMGYLYAPGPYYRRIRTFLREYQRPKISRAMNWESFRAFLHANLRLGIFGRERFHYWGLLIWTFFRRPMHLPLAVTLSIYGYHFRKTCKVLGV